MAKKQSSQPIEQLERSRKEKGIIIRSKTTEGKEMGKWKYSAK
jgi:hypothetical protein